MRSRLPLVAFLVLAVVPPLEAQDSAFTRADTLRGSITPQRAWWDVTFYDLHVRLDPSDSTIRGWNGITYRVTGKAREMQIDLQEPLVMDSAVQNGKRVRFRREGNASQVGGVVDDVVDQTEEAVDEVVPGPGFVVQAALQERLVGVR